MPVAEHHPGVGVHPLEGVAVQGAGQHAVGVEASEVRTVRVYMMTGPSVKTQEFLTKGPMPCRPMPLLVQL